LCCLQDLRKKSFTKAVLRRANFSGSDLTGERVAQEQRQQQKQQQQQRLQLYQKQQEWVQQICLLPAAALNTQSSEHSDTRNLTVVLGLYCWNYQRTLLHMILVFWKDSPNTGVH
jgi:hypothetical protein